MRSWVFDCLFCCGKAADSLRQVRGISFGLCTRLVCCITRPVNKPAILSPVLPVAFPVVFHYLNAFLSSVIAVFYPLSTPPIRATTNYIKVL